MQSTTEREGLTYIYTGKIIITFELIIVKYSVQNANKSKHVAKRFHEATSIDNEEYLEL